MTKDSHEPPPSWATARLDQVGEINPTIDKSKYEDDLVVSFVPMPAVEAESGEIDVSGSRSFGSVRKGYTHFQQGDVLFAKITPCMENGKMAIVPEVKNGLGFGSTEFHVLRPSDGVQSAFIYYFVSSARFRYDAEHNMTGAVGQRRVPVPYLSGCEIPVPPTNEQRRIVARIEELFSELDKGVESLKRAREQLKTYRQAVLKHAFEGKLTADWRAANADKLETADQLLARIQTEREARYKQQLKEWQTAVNAGEERKEGRKPVKPKKPADLEVIPSEDYMKLPDGWAWVRYGDFCSGVRNGISKKPSGTTGAKIFRISAVRPMEFDLSDVRFIDNSDGRFDDYFLQAGDLVFTRYNGSRAYVGVCAEYKSDGSHLYPDKLVRTRLAVACATPGYFEKALNCGESRSFIEKRIRTTAGQSGVSGGDIKAVPVPVCGQAEQLTIDSRLEQELSRVASMINDIDENLLRADTLRQSILKKAFSGQLVPQDPNDEPASRLLARIRAEKAAQATTRRISRSRKRA